jgi:hypothetical protein
MTSKESRYSHIEVSGEGICPVLRAIRAEALCKVLLAKHGLKDVRKGDWYPVTSYLGLLYDMAERMPRMLRKVGTFIMTEIILPPGLDSFEIALREMHATYMANHRGVQSDEFGGYDFRQESDGVYRVSCSIPYPCTFVEGIIYGMAKKFNTSIHIEHATTLCRANGDDQCDYRITVV